MKKQRASFTVEATIVMSTIIFAMFAILSAFLLVYQNAVMYYVASRAAQEGAVMWSDPSHTLDGSEYKGEKQGYYYRLGELFAGETSVSVRSGDKKKSASGVQGKEYEIAFWALKQLSKLSPGTIVGNGRETVTVTLHNYIFLKEVEVSIVKEVNIPFREIAKYFPSNLDMKVTVQASVYGPTEYIRNVDYSIELAHELWGKVKDKLEPLLKSKE